LLPAEAPAKPEHIPAFCIPVDCGPWTVDVSTPRGHRHHTALNPRLWIFLLPVFCLILLACERDLEIDMAIEPPVVVNALFNSDSTWRIRVNKAWAMGEATFGATSGGPVVWGHLSKNIENAHVSIMSGSGEQITLAYDTNGFYLSPLKPRAGETYRLSVNVPGELPISSEVVLPKPVRPDTGYVTKVSEYDYLLTLEFTDPPGPTAYELTVYENASDSMQFAQLETDDQDVHVETYWTPRNDYPDNGATLGPLFWALNDRNFQEQKKKLVFRMFVYGGLPETWTVQMRTLSDAYSQYRTTSVKQQETYNDPFAQPIQVYNNINNGVGIFAGYSRLTYTFKSN
jgi:hypothetical protein